MATSFVQQMRMCKCHRFCVSMHRHVPYESKQDFNNGAELKRNANCESAFAVVKFELYLDTLEGTKWTK